MRTLMGHSTQPTKLISVLLIRAGGFYSSCGRELPCQQCLNEMDQLACIIMKFTTQMMLMHDLDLDAFRIDKVLSCYTFFLGGLQGKLMRFCSMFQFPHHITEWKSEKYQYWISPLISLSSWTGHVLIFSKSPADFTCLEARGGQRSTGVRAVRA